ncbi:MAG: SH3 domain-containing protein [Paracoccaceae bacterium]|nr:SH3 domain-containing protein [Paracoccaceae bacterium]
MNAARLVLSCLATAATLALSAPAARAVEAAASTPLNVRSGPGAGYGVVDVLDPGEVVDVGECRASGWCYVTHRGPDGWVFSNYLTLPPGTAEAQPGRDCRLMLTFDAAGPSLRILCGRDGIVFPPTAEAGRACFYTGTGFTGRRFCTGAGTINRLDANFNDRISSVRVFGSARARLCQDTSLGGFCRTVSDDEPSLGRALNDRVSSLAVFTGGWSRPGPRPPVTYSSGRIDLPRTRAANLDTGAVGGPGVDIWYRAPSPFLSVIAPLGGARLALGDGSDRGYAGCRAERFSNAEIPLSELPVGTHLCVRTDEGRIAQFRVDGFTRTAMRIGYTTWAN